MDAIVLDGNQRSSLAITRSLGKRGLSVAVGEERGNSLSSRSRHSVESFTYPSPARDPAGFVEALRTHAQGKRGAVLFPGTDVTMKEVLARRGLLEENLRIPFAEVHRYDSLTDKWNLFSVAERSGVPIPRTVFPRGGTGAGRFPESPETDRLGFPVVVKPARSRVWSDGHWAGTAVAYASDETELERIRGEKIFRAVPFLLQERIEGPGVGIFLLMQDGEVLARFAHRRIREKPPSGGVSVLCESIEPPPDALRASICLLGEMRWTGVAMVEFKRDRRDGVHKLMEVNARFWGSLQLAVSCGVDFPYLLYRMAKGEAVRGPNRYRVGLRSRWELGDLDHLLIRLCRKPEELSLPRDAPTRMSVLREFLLDSVRPSVRHEILRPDDPGPFLFELREYFRHLRRREPALVRPSGDPA